MQFFLADLYADRLSGNDTGRSAVARPSGPVEPTRHVASTDLAAPVERAAGGSHDAGRTPVLTGGR